LLYVWRPRLSGSLLGNKCPINRTGGSWPPGSSQISIGSPNEERVMNLNNIEFGMGATFAALPRRRTLVVVFALLLIVGAILPGRAWYEPKT